MKKICIIVDNEKLYTTVKDIINNQSLEAKYEFTFYTSGKARPLDGHLCWNYDLRVICLKELPCQFWEQYDLFISLHCRQCFPQYIVQKYRCINVHPGYNPFNRGWYPQVFSIINKKPVGATIHEMDSEIDHGPIIYEECVEINDDDTSYTLYQKIQEKECKLLESHLEELIEERYVKHTIETEGNVNRKRDFESLCRIDLNKKATYKEVIDFLRAMTFENYKNAYFMDAQGNKIYVKLELEKRVGECVKESL